MGDTCCAEPAGTDVALEHGSRWVDSWRTLAAAMSAGAWATGVVGELLDRPAAARVAFIVARISSRYNPNVRCRALVARLAALIAANAIPRPSASVAMCPASDSNANDPVITPTTTCTTRKPTIKPNDQRKRPAWRAPARAVTLP